ncbi:hypothetical protein RJ641_015852, partial [Dillenia turbinata]
WGGGGELENGGHNPRKQLLPNALESNSTPNHSSFLQLLFSLSRIMVSLLQQLDPMVELQIALSSSGFLDDTHEIQINTDSRSRKVLLLRLSPSRFQPCALRHSHFLLFDGIILDPIKLQVRGCHTYQQRDQAWSASLLKSRLQYLGPKHGVPCFSEEPPPQQFSLDPSAGPVSAYCLLVLDPD